VRIPSLATRSQLDSALRSMGDWSSLGIDLRVDSSGFGPLSCHRIRVRFSGDDEGDGWADRGLMLVELAGIRDRWSNVNYRVEVL
jgi:hypothetical protein